MRKFNKLFVISLPRCATVSVASVVGTLGIPIAHLGRIPSNNKLGGEFTQAHFELANLQRMREQIEGSDFDLDILLDCRGLADYPACCPEVWKKLDHHYPASLFINVRRDNSVDRWLQSVETQFVGSDLLARQASDDSPRKAFVELMRCFRTWTFGCETFECARYQAAYHQYQALVEEYFRGRDQLLDFADIDLLHSQGISRICDFLQIKRVDIDFPFDNRHSLGPSQAFHEALLSGEIQSQTGATPQ